MVPPALLSSGKGRVASAAAPPTKQQTQQAQQAETRDGGRALATKKALEANDRLREALVTAISKVDKDIVANRICSAAVLSRGLNVFGARILGDPPEATRRGREHDAVRRRVQRCAGKLDFELEQLKKRLLITNRERAWRRDERKLLLEAVARCGGAGCTADTVENAVNWPLVGSYLAKRKFGGRTAGDCRLRYMNVEAPGLNFGPWSKNEEAHLASLVERNGAAEWAAISRELGTRRPPIDCLKHYQRALSNEALSERWSTEEDAALTAAVSCMGENRDWSIAAGAVPGRSAQQCSYRWRKSLDPLKKRQRWSPEEERRLALAVRACSSSDGGDGGGGSGADASSSVSAAANNDAASDEAAGTGVRNGAAGTATFDLNWGQVAIMVPGRTDVQCREKWANVLDPSVKRDDLTEEEEAALAAAVRSCGVGRWAEVAKLLPGRTARQCRQEWAKIAPDLEGKRKKEGQKERAVKRVCAGRFWDKRDKSALQPEDFVAAEDGQEEGEEPE